MIPPKWPFAAHAMIETAAALSFILRPEGQLPGCSPAARLILQQYGGLLLTTNLVCVAVLLEPGFGGLCRAVAAALATYHVWPCYRAYVRLRLSNTSMLGDSRKARSTFGGPVVHLVVHLMCLVMFVSAAVVGDGS